MSPRRRYQLRRSDLNERIEGLIQAACREGTEPDDAELIRQVVTTGIHLLRDGTSRAELKLVNSALKELRHAFRVFGPYEEKRKVAVFGSARTTEDHPDYRQAHAFAEAMRERGWMSITGAGDGIMGGPGRRGARLLLWRQHPSALRASGERDDRGRREADQLSLLLHAQGRLREGVPRDRALSGRLRNPRRGPRSAHADPDREERDGAGRLRRRARGNLLARLDGLGRDASP